MKRLMVILGIIIIFCSLNSISGVWEVIPNMTNKNRNKLDYIYSYDSLTYIATSEHSNYAKNTKDLIMGWDYLLTKDYGQTWDTIFSSRHIMYGDGFTKLDSPEDIQMLSQDTILFTHTFDIDDTKLLKTFNGGATWDTVSLPISRSFIYGKAKRVLFFKDVNTGMIVNMADTVMYTEDGGNTWDVFKLPKLDTCSGYAISGWDKVDDTLMLYTTYRGIYFDSTDNHYRYVDNYYRAIVKTTDFGKSWDLVMDTYDSLYTPCYRSTSFFMRNYNEIWAVIINKNDSGKKELVMRKSLDGGHSWELVCPIGTFQFSDLIKFSGPRQIVFFEDQIIFQTDFFIYRSYDNGKSWEKEDLSTTKEGDYTLIYIAFATPTKAIGNNFFERLIYRYVENTSVEEDKISPCLLYPNPVRKTENLNIVLPDDNKFSTYTITVYDYIGNEIDKYEATQMNKQIRYKPDESMTRGTYSMIIEAEGQVIFKEKFIVE